MPTSIRTNKASENLTSPRGLKYVPTHMIPKTLSTIDSLGKDVKEIPFGQMLASMLEFGATLIENVEKQGKVVEFKHEKLERGNWRLSWNIVNPKPKQAKK